MNGKKPIEELLGGYLNKDIWMYDNSKIKNDPTLRLCDICKQRKPRELGKYVPINELNQKWYCQHCYELRNKR